MIIRNDFINIADQRKLACIARARKLTGLHDTPDYMGTEKRCSILLEFLGTIDADVAVNTSFHCNFGNKSVIKLKCCHTFYTGKLHLTIHVE